MPLPMVHLCVAKELTIYKEQFIDCPEFYLGTISPDAIHMRENNNRCDKKISHLISDNKIDVSCVVEFLRESKEKTNYNFLLGYGIHILTDHFWNETVYKSFVDRYNEDLYPIQPISEAYYNDTDRIDIELYKHHEWRPIMWRLLGRARASEVKMILSAEEISRWNLRTLNWFDEYNTSNLNPIRYITYDEVLAFINYTAKNIIDILESERL